jgi:hypothetical protein
LRPKALHALARHPHVAEELEAEVVRRNLSEARLLEHQTKKKQTF